MRGAEPRRKVMMASMSTKLAVLVSAATLLAACGPDRGGGQGAASPAASPTAQPGAGSSAASPAAQHDIRGRVDAISRERGTITLDHEEIPGVMAAMKMEYSVSDPALLDRLSVADSVAGRIEQRAGSYVIVSLQKR
jgi:protein SCO1/2